MGSLEQRVEQLGTMADDMAGVMQVTPEFLADQYPHVRVDSDIKYIKESDRGPAAALVAGVAFGASRLFLQPEYGPENLEVVLESRLPGFPSTGNGLGAYSEALAHTGLGHLQSTRAMQPIRIQSPEAVPLEPRSVLTNGLFRSIRAVQLLGSEPAEHTDRPLVRTLEDITQHLAKTVIAVTLDYPDKVFLATDTPTEEQMTAIHSLTPRLTRKDRKMVERSVAAASKTNLADSIDTEEWSRGPLRQRIKNELIMPPADPGSRF